MQELNQVDLAFVVDTTGSMGAFINVAQRQMIAMLQALSTPHPSPSAQGERGRGEGAKTPIDLRLGIVEYRDHPPQDHTFVARPHAFTSDLARAQKTINGLKPDGGGDAPEAVYDGLSGACELEWRQHSQRLAVLIGDAPPHGCGGGGDGFPGGCPCGQSSDSITALLEQQGIALYAIGLTRLVNESFGRLARFTGGDYFQAEHGDAALQALEDVLAREFADIAFDLKVLEYCSAHLDWTVDSICEALASSRGRLSASLSRLGRRGLIGKNSGQVIANPLPATIE
jgi:hypothetical protein